MDALNWLRAVLVGCAFVAALLLAVERLWIPAAVFGVGILAHFWLFHYLHQQRKRERATPPLHLRNPDLTG